MTLGIIIHVDKPGALPALRRLLTALRKARLASLLERKTAALIGEEGGLTVAQLGERCDLLVVMGGDGTILRVVHQLKKHLPPIFGINLGSLGFLTCLGSEEIPRAVQTIRQGEYELSARRLLAATVWHKGKAHTFTALNDVVMSRGERSQLVKIRVLIDGEPLTDYFADGLIVATPTGSTAYSLSSGGPILLPESRTLVVTPICPHVLTNRSVVVGDHSVISLEPSAPGQEIFVTVDGRDIRKISSQDRLEIRLSDRVLPLARPAERSFSEILRLKLKWTGSNI
jgi:NAD+ kinase